jgi:hypothetical protein
MATLPSATVTLDQSKRTIGAGTAYLTMIAPVTTHADGLPRLYTTWKDIVDYHGYNEGAEYAALHFERAKGQILFCGIPIVTVGIVGQIDQSGNTGTSVVNVAAGVAGILAETDGVVTVVRGGTVGTSQITLKLSLDGGRTEKDVRLGTATSYTIPYVGLVLSFKAGTLVADDVVLTWHSKAPLWDSAGLILARTGLAAQLKQSRSWLVIGDVATDTEANLVLTQANAYDTSNDRPVHAKVSIASRLPIPKMSKTRVRMTGSPQITFAEVGATGDTITRSAGSFLTDGFANGMFITVTGAVASSGANNITGKVTGVAETVLTLDTADLIAEGPISGVGITGTAALSFAEVGSTADTITRSHGSWLDDGFKAGDEITITGTASNNIVAAAVTTVTATVLTLDTTDLVVEEIGSYGVSVTAARAKAAWVALVDAEFADIDGESARRIDLGYERCRITSPITGAYARRSVQWIDTFLAYTHSEHKTTWATAQGGIAGISLDDEDGNLVEHDERVDSGALAGRFTCFRTWSNNPGVYIAMSLTRNGEGTLLSLTNNQAVADLCQRVAQAAVTLEIGQVYEKNADGTLSGSALQVIKNKVDDALERALLGSNQFNDGPRCSYVFFTPSDTDVFTTVPAYLTGQVSLNLNGTITDVAVKLVVS